MVTLIKGDEPSHELDEEIDESDLGKGKEEVKSGIEEVEDESDDDNVIQEI